MSGRTDRDDARKTEGDEADATGELSDAELDACAGGTAATLSAARQTVAIGMLLPAVQKVRDSRS